ncbi:hypothetical protein [Gracilimonas sp.]|uniref:hypothetical protein n=1 Tax=Gracilimonas sp. TaxID=1974203 RepID=UPI0032ED637D
MKYTLLVILLAFTTACGSKKQEENNVQASEPEAMAVEAAPSENQYYDYSKIDETLAIDVNSISCKYLMNSIVSCDFNVTNPNQRNLYDLFVTFYPINENGETGELGISQMDAGDYAELKAGETGSFSAVLTSFPRSTEYLRFTIETNEKPYDSNIQDFDTDQIQGL